MDFDGAGLTGAKLVVAIWFGFVGFVLPPFLFFAVLTLLLVIREVSGPAGGRRPSTGQLVTQRPNCREASTPSYLSATFSPRLD